MDGEPTRATTSVSVMRRLASHLLFLVAATLLALMAIALLLQIIAREGAFGVDWTEEIARYGFISMVFVASAYATLRGAHLRVSVFSDLVARRIGQVPVRRFHLAVLIVFDALMVWFAVVNVLDGIRYPNTSPALGFNQNLLFVPFAIGFAISGCIHLSDFVTARIDPDDKGQPGDVQDPNVAAAGLSANGIDGTSSGGSEGR